MKLSYVDWEHDEVELFEDGEQEIGTTFNNSQFIYRGVFEQGKHGPLSGRFGFWGIDREYAATGEEALSPPVDQNGFAIFVLEELDFERVKFQLGGRVRRSVTIRHSPSAAMRSTEPRKPMTAKKFQPPSDALLPAVPRRRACMLASGLAEPS